MQTFASIINDLGGGAVVARAIGVEPGTVRQWKGRNGIPADLWPKIVQFASEQGKDGVTYEQLAKLAEHEAKAKPKPRRRAA